MFTVPKSKQIRLLVDSDARCEADDAFAIVHDLLTPQFQVKGILAEHFGERPGVENSMLASYEECKTIVDTDARCEADDAFAIVHDLLTPQF